jgi:hypothetical protein
MLRKVGLLFFLSFSGCFSLVQFQSPKVLEERESELIYGGGIILTFDDHGHPVMWLEPFMEGRIGVGSGIDVGIRTFGFAPVWGIMGDLKYQLEEDPLYISADLGASLGGGLILGEHQRFTNFALYPALIVGTDRFYVSTRGILLAFPFVESDEDDHFAFFYGISTGYLFGNRIGIAPEFNILWTAGQKLSRPSLALALGLTVKLMGF